MNGLEILTETIVEPPVIMPIICISLLILLGLVCLIVSVSGDADRYTIVVIIVGLICFIMAGVIIHKMSNDKPITIYKVTPTEENYHIDLDKYKVLNKDGKIIELKEK